MLKIKNVKAIRYRGYAIYSTSKVTCVTCKINKRKFIPFSNIKMAKICVDLLTIKFVEESQYVLWDSDTMLKRFEIIRKIDL